ncbi:MAG: reverse transcriptase family protein, partial [Candidatus Thiodiazotropha endolucinida]|nr:reverse transcriptase family protein [Candidatus Thiodiazotropha taylori]
MIMPEENNDETNNYSRVRRLTFVRKEPYDESRNISRVARAYVKGKTAQMPVHLSDLYERTVKGLNANEKERIFELLTQFQDNFSKDEWDIGLTHLTEHAIPTGDAATIKQPPRRLPLAHAEAEKKAIEDLKAKGVIRDSTSQWASPIVLVAKKDGDVRPCVDYRRLNELLKPDGFPLPRIQDCLDAVALSALFSTFDLLSGYFQIPVKEEDIPKTAFVCKYGHYEMTRMPQGLNSSALTFQRTMELALQGLQWVTCLIYIDDIIVFGKNFEEHV